MAKDGFVYIMASGRNRTLYISVRRPDPAVSSIGKASRTATKKYGCKTLVWYEQFGDIEQPPAREADEGMEAALEAARD